MKERILLSSPHMGGNEIKYINQAFEQNWIAPLGPNVNNFETELASYLKTKHVAVLSSGTAAIHLALILLGVDSGDEVLVSSCTFSATVNPIVYQKAIPILIDSESETWNMSPELLEEAINDRIKKGKKPKAIILVHLYGVPAKIDEILNISKKYDIPLIEDAAEALGAYYKDQHVGTFGKFGIMSFNGNKIITTSGGGALFSEDEEAIVKARFLSTQARDNAPHYQHTHIGYNYRMSNISAGIGRGQLEVIDERVQLRRKAFDFYCNLFKDFDGVSFLDEPKDTFCNRWLTTIIIDPAKANGIDREKLRLELENENIEARPLWKPMHLQPIFADYPAYTNGVSEDLFNNGLCLPSGSNMKDSEFERIEKILRRLFNL